MILDIEDKALDFIREKGKIVAIHLFASKSCCVSLSEPKVTFGKPENIQKFDEYIIDDVFVYTDKFIEVKDEELKIQFNKVLGVKYLSVEGVKTGL